MKHHSPCKNESSRPRRFWLLLALSVWVLMLPGCKDEITGPKPVVADPSVSAETMPISPGIVCRDQRVTDVVITGSGFSPVPIDVPDKPRTALPTVTLTRNQQLDGAGGDALEVVYNGDPEKGQNVSLLSWQSQQQMTFNVVPPCADDSGCGEGYVCGSAGVCAKSAEDEQSKQQQGDVARCARGHREADALDADPIDRLSRAGRSSGDAGGDAVFDDQRGGR